jgi:hypothetical protein
MGAESPPGATMAADAGDVADVAYGLAASTEEDDLLHVHPETQSVSASATTEGLTFLRLPGLSTCGTTCAAIPPRAPRR